MLFGSGELDLGSLNPGIGSQKPAEVAVCLPSIHCLSPLPQTDSAPNRTHDLRFLVHQFVATHSVSSQMSHVSDEESDLHCHLALDPIFSALPGMPRWLFFVKSPKNLGPRFMETVGAPWKAHLQRLCVIVVPHLGVHDDKQKLVSSVSRQCHTTLLAMSRSDGMCEGDSTKNNVHESMSLTKRSLDQE